MYAVINQPHIEVQHMLTQIAIKFYCRRFPRILGRVAYQAASLDMLMDMLPFGWLCHSMLG